jgi:hypothetical protein
MATAWVEIRDNSIWFRHISGPHVVRQLQALEPEETVRLRIAGKVGVWKRMRRQEGSGALTEALKPGDDATKASWNGLYGAHRGEHVEIEIVDAGALPKVVNRLSDAERDAAWATFLELTHAGWVSGEPLTRDDLHDRR